MPNHHHQLELRANCALSAGECIVAFGMIAFASLSVAMICVVNGYWPVLPFAGLELAFLAWALRATWRNGQAREQLTFTADEIIIERLQYGADEPDVITLPRSWTRAALMNTQGRPGGSRLVLGRQGRWWTIGRFLPDPEKRSLKRRIDEILRQNPHEYTVPGSVEESSPELGKK